MLYAFLKPLAVALMRVIFGLEGRGRQHVPMTGPVLLVSNHSSVLDPPLIGGVTPRPVSFLAKAELFGIPLFGRFIRMLNARPVRREGADPAALRTALRILQEGRVLLVFPEGTRGAEGELRAGKAGAGMLAVLSGAQVVPVYISGSGRAWPKGRRLPRASKVIVRFGAPQRFGGGNGAPRKDLYESVSREMMSAIARLRDAEGAQAGSASPRESRLVVGEVSAGGVSASPKYTQGRNGQHGEG